jgi:putative Mg2+ transporter-C (MgtC) family protein
MMNISMYLEEVGQISAAFAVGAILGIEREFRSKPAGFRTMILISVGSCLYTLLSKDMGSDGSSDRIASNIVTGIGFIGAGVIFKEGITVNGLTTAALIWITAALGMAIGNHNYPVALVVTVIVVIALFVLEPVQRFINHFHKVKDYRIRIINGSNHFKADLEEFFNANGLSYHCMKTHKENMDPIFLYRISSPDRNYDLVNQFLLSHPEVKSFDV